MCDEKTLEQYSRMVDDFAWYGKGDIFAIAKLAKKLGRNYFQDVVERKQVLYSSEKK